MANATYLNVLGQTLEIKDAEARAKANESLDLGVELRDQSIGDYNGGSLLAEFAGEIANYDNEWQWLRARAREGNFDGLMIGKYLDVTLSTGYQMRYRIGAIDPYYMCGDTPNGHHITMVPDQVAITTGSYAVNGNHVMWNTTANNNGDATEKHPYLASNLYAYLNTEFYNSLPIDMRECIVDLRMIIEERYSTAGAQTAATGWSWVNEGKVWSPSMVEILGHESWATKGFAGGIDCQFPIFAITKNRIKRNGDSRVGWWSRDPSGVSAANACYVNAHGIAHTNSTANAGFYALPCSHIG